MTRAALLIAAALAACGPVEGPAARDGARVAPVQVGVTVHLEARDAHDEQTFRAWAETLRHRAALFESFDAPLTLEAQVITDGVELWGDNVLLEMQDRGHAIGVHADLGGHRWDTTEGVTADLIELRERHEDLGLDVRHVSGICSHTDWITAAVDAGFEFTSSVVTYCLQSLPEEDRPARYVDCSGPADCHDAFPLALENRITPRRVMDGATWLEADPEGEFLVMPAQGALACLAEVGDGEISPTSCDFDEDDIEIWRLGLERAIEISEPGAVLDYHVSWSFGDALDPDMIALWLETMDSYRAAGLVEWRALPEVNDRFVAQE